MRRKSTTPVFLNIYRLVSVQRTSLEMVPPPRDQLSIGGQSELISWWFVPEHIHGTSSSTPISRYNPLALAVTWNIIFWCPVQRRQFRLSRRKSKFSFFFNDSLCSWELERNGHKKKEKSAFSGVIMAFLGRKTSNVCFVMLLCVNPSAGICFAGSGHRSTWLRVFNRYLQLISAF